MIGFVVSVDTMSTVVPQLRFGIELENDSNDPITLYGCSGEVSLASGTPVRKLGNLDIPFMSQLIQPRGKTLIYSTCAVGYRELDFIEVERKGGDLVLIVDLQLLRLRTPAGRQPTFGDIGADSCRVSSPDSKYRSQQVVCVPQSEWAKLLEQMGYAKVKIFEIVLPSPPLGTALDTTLQHLQKAQEHFNQGDYPDVLTNCRKAIDELSKVVGTEPERQKFVAKMLDDEKKAEAWDDLWQTIQKAKNFGSGGPHTYWVKAANRLDAELVLQVTFGIVGYFAKNLAKQKA